MSSRFRFVIASLCLLLAAPVFAEDSNDCFFEEDCAEQAYRPSGGGSGQAAGAIIGGIVGALLGSQVGKGKGRTAARPEPARSRALGTTRRTRRVPGAPSSRSSPRRISGSPSLGEAGSTTSWTASFSCLSSRFWA